MRYYDLNEAVAELRWRQKDAGLISKVASVVGADCPYYFGENGFLARQVATCRLEDVDFLHRCSRVGLNPVWVEYLQDRFTVRNPDKNRLCKIPVFLGYGRNGGIKTLVYRLVANPSQWEEAAISFMKTDGGESLVSFHHRLWQAVIGKGEIRDASIWYRRLGGRAKDYYFAYLAAMTVNGVLFEDFEGNEPGLVAFRNEIVGPAYGRALEVVGLPPLIVKHPTSSGGKGSKVDMLSLYVSDVRHVVPFLL